MAMMSAEAPEPVRREIRIMHPHGFRSGQWARLIGTTDLPMFPEGDRRCYLVEFPDGKADFWYVNDPQARYEFREVQ
jgi:hypothetical protein